MGERFIKSRDHAVILIFDVAGYIAGIQIGVSIAFAPEVSCVYLKNAKGLVGIFFPTLIKINFISTDNV
jgi:hypothetical protein